jgi:DNA-binding transcriptional regulator YdaS (Cro superfamily)
VKAAVMRIAVSSSTFRRPLAAGELTQLEWLERCASQLDADGVLADLADFPRTDLEYTAQLRKIAVDLGLVPFGLDAAGLFDRDAAAARESTLALATALGGLVVRSALPPPGDLPPAAYVETVAIAKALGSAAKAANVTLLVPPAPGTLGEDLSAVKRLLKDADSAWLRPCPRAVDEAAAIDARDLFPAVSARPDDDPAAVLARAGRPWVLLEALAGDRPWDTVAAAIAALRDADAERRLARTESSGKWTRPQRPSGT